MNNLSPQIVVVGSHAPGIFIRVKAVPRAGETVLGWDFHEPVDGGKGSNQAIAAALLGKKIGFVGCVGMDRVGQEGEQWMRNAGVDTTWLQKLEGISSGIGFIVLNQEGVPAMVTSMGANAELTCAFVEQALGQMREASVLLTQLEIPVEVAIHAARIARQLGMISIVNPAPAPETWIEGLESASILVPNENEAKTLLGMDADSSPDPIEMAVRLRERSKSGCVMITLGKEGAVGSESSGEVWSIHPPAVPVADTSGAGDAFCAGLAVGLSEGMDLRRAAQWACSVAALSVSRKGTIPSYPTRDEVLSFMANHQAA